MNKELQVLQRFYEKLKDVLILRRKIKKTEKSIFEPLINTKSNELYRILDSAALSGSLFSEVDINKLLKNQLIRMTDNFNQYTLTANGIWFFEKKQFNFTDDVFTDIIDKKFINLFGQTTSITDKEKIVLLLLIVLRAFSKNSYLHLTNNDLIYDKLMELIDECKVFLIKINEITPNEQGYYGKPGNDHIVYNFIRHTDLLPKKTKGLYTAMGNDHKYLLNIFDEETKNMSIFENNLDFIVGLIFKKKLDFLRCQELINFINDRYQKYFLIVFDSIESHIFNQPEFTEIIEKTFFKHKK